MDFSVYKCLSLPDLLDMDKPQGGNSSFGAGSGARNGGANFGRGGGSSYGGRGGGQSGSSRPPRNQDASVFVGNLSYASGE